MNQHFTLKLVTTFFILNIFFNNSIRSQIVINEICPANISVILNSNGDYDDWIELHNSSASTVNLSGYGLSDDPLKPYRFTFPSYNLSAGGKILVFASDSTSQTVVHHWEMPVDALSSWKYASGSSSLDTNWRNLSFNQTPWSTGNGGIGYADGDDNTVIGTTASVMMRKTFNIPDTSQILKCVLMMDYDDGFVAYLNGVEIARANLGTVGTRPAWNELANSSHEALRYQGQQADSFFISPSVFKSLLKVGTNVLAVETHNVTATGSDLSSIPFLMFGMRSSGSTYSAIPSWFHPPVKEYFNAKFKLSRTGETVYLTNPSGTVSDQKTYTSIESNNSLCRKPDGSSTWCFVSTPTPDATNNSSTCYSGYASVPIFSRQGGFYANTQTLTLTQSTPGGVIRYTTNGNVPTASSPQYTSTITLSSPKVIRARVFASGYLPSPTVTNSYFIGETTELPTISITTDSLNLWDYNTGIYATGPNADPTYPYKGANFWMNWEKPASIEIFDKNQSLISKFDADIEIYGNYSRAKPQKSFEIKLSDKYGMGSLNYPLYSDKPFVDQIDNFILRNSGTDWNKVHFRDAFMERVMKNTYSGYLAASPAIAYLNGSYWGVYCMYENHDEHWFKNNFGLGKSEIDYLKEGGSSMEIGYGSDVTFWDLYNYATVQNPSTQTYYNYVNSLLDLQNYTDYFIAETYFNNGDWIGDWTNNIKLWRSNKPGSKWKYLLYDLDFGLGYSGSVNDNRLAIARNPAAFSISSELFDAVLNNPTYKRYFINRYCDLMNTIYKSTNMNNVMLSYKDSMASDMVNHFAKWGSNVSTWNSNISSMMTFANARTSKMKDFIKAEFGLGSVVTLTFAVSPANAGRIEVSTIIPTTYPWTGDYFKNNTVTITAIPNPGYTFDHWRSTGVINSNNYNQSVTYNFTGSETITCYFTGSSAPANVCVSELNYNSDSALNAGDWIELKNYGSTSINLSGWHLSDGSDNHNYYFPTGTVIPANGYLVLVEDTAKFKSQFPTISKLGPVGFNFSNGGDQIRLFNHTNSLYLSFYYQDLSPWPLGPDGGGYTLELTTNTANPNNAASWFEGCLGGSPGRAFSSALSSPVSVAGNTTFCNGQSVTLNATSVPGYTYQWKRNNVIISGATNPSYVASQAGSYTVVASEQGCSSESAPVSVTVVAQQPPPQVVPAYRCGSGVLTLNASSTDSIFWYDSNVGGNQVGVGNTFVTPNLSTTTTYYARTGISCQSASASVVATVLPETAVPVASNVTRCGPGVVTLTASDTATIHWYNQASGGALLETGPTFLTNILNNDTSFYVEAGDVCPSPRLEVLVTVNTTPSVVTGDTSRCGPGSLTLLASSAAPISWYTTQSGGSAVGTGPSYTTANLSVSDTLYVEANSGCPSFRERAIAIIFQIPAPPVVTDTFLCTSGSVDIPAVATEQISWFDASSGGNLLYSGTTFTTPTLNASTTYYLSNGYYCPSARVPVTVSVSSPAQPPTSADVSRCGPGQVTLVAASPELIYWYDAPTGGNFLLASDVFVTPTLSSTTTYYAEAGTFCRSLLRTAAQAIIDPIPASPSASNVSRCGDGSVTLTATSPDPISWFASASGGSALATGGTYTTNISSTTTFYVEAGTSTCKSSRIPVQAIVSSAPSAPAVTGGNRCGSGSVNLSATSSSSINWYSVSSGGSPIGTGTSFSTPTISSTTTYYAEADNGCTSTRVPVQAVIDPIPAAPVTAAVSRCGAGSVTLTATSSEQIYWYTSPTGGTSVATGTSYTTTVSTTTTFYVETGDVCRSARISVQAIVNANPSSPSLTGATICNSGSATLTAASSNTVTWYSVPSGGSPIGTGLSYTTPSISVSTTYYAQATSGTCVSPRVSVQATVNSAPAAPLAIDGNRCGPGSVNLSATGSGTLNWYASSSGGSVLGSGSNFSTPSISTNTVYYVEATNGCPSSRTAVNAIINTQPASPVTANVSNCGPGALTLTATSPEQIYWFTTPSGTTPVATGSSYTTPTISATTTYYVEAGNTCRSVRIPVQAIINSTPNAPAVAGGSVCGSGSATLTATSSSQVTWYAGATGGSPLGTGLSFNTPTITTNTTFYAQASNGTCVSARVPVQATILALPAAPVTVDGTRCGQGTVSLSASGAGTISWYASATGGTALGTGSSFTTPSISTTTVYYAEANDGCASLRSAVNAVINQAPNAPTTADVSRCGAGSVTFTASSPEQIYWYTVPTGGTSVGTGTTFTTQSLSATTTFYVETGNQCRSQRIPVQAIINSTPAAPVLTNGSICGPGSVTVTATSSSTVTWYSSATGGSPLGTGTSFNTPVISTTTTFYAEAGQVGCASARVAVQAIILQLPQAPSVTAGSNCGPGSITLSANSPTQVYWYASSSGGTPLDSGTTFNTGNLNTSATYYAGTTDGVCESQRTAAVATIIPLPAAPVTNDVSRCGPGIVTLTATSPEQIYWYNAPSGGGLLGTGPSYTTSTISTSSTFYVETGNNCRSVRIPVLAVITSTPNPPSVMDSVRCGPGTLVLQANSPLQVNWYDSPSGGNLLDTGLIFTTPFISTSTVYYVDAGIGCNSVRVPVNANIVSAPPAPVVNNTTRCGSGTVVLTASSPEIIYWYDAPSGGNLLTTGTSFTTPPLNANATYYVETGDFCLSTRVPIQAIIGGTQVTSAFDAVLCGSGSAVISASSSVAIDSISWYDAPGGNFLGSGQYYTTSFLNYTTTFYAVAHSSCTGQPVAVNAFVFNLPVVNLGADTVIIPSGQSLTLDGGPGFMSYSWSTTETTPSIVVSAEGLYTLTVTDSNGCSGSDNVFVDFYTAVNNLNGKSPLAIYPNPTHGNITVVLPEASGNQFELKLLSMDGKIVRYESVNTFNRKTDKLITLAGIAAGVYILEVRSSDNAATVKVFVQ